MWLFSKHKKGTEKEMTEFAFDENPKTAVITCNHIIDNSEPILYVSHDSEDGMWQFMCGRNHSIDEAKIVSLEFIFRKDQSVSLLANLPCGYYAERMSIDDKWIINKH